MSNYSLQKKHTNINPDVIKINKRAADEKLNNILLLSNAFVSDFCATNMIRSNT